LNRKNIFIFFTLFLLLFISFIIAALFGGSQLNLTKAIYYLFHANKRGVERDIIWIIRIPRIILGAVVGGGLACCGTIFQGLLRNPLAEPYTLGISGGAAFGVALGIILDLSAVFLPILAFGLYHCFKKSIFKFNSYTRWCSLEFSFLFSSLFDILFCKAGGCSRNNSLVNGKPVNHANSFN